MLAIHLQNMPVVLDTAEIRTTQNDNILCQPKADCIVSCSSRSSGRIRCDDKVLNKPRRLPSGYTPGPYDVICARGKAPWHHSGNKYFRELVKNSSTSYSQATSKRERSALVAGIVRHMYSKGTGFVKEERGRKGVWTEIGDILAREKAGQLLRNCLSSIYRSSHVAKNKRKRSNHVRRMEGLQEVMQSNPMVAQSMATLEQVGFSSDDLSDEQILARFTQAQCNIIHTIKSDSQLVERFQQAEITSQVMLNADSDDSDSDGDVLMADC